MKKEVGTKSETKEDGGVRLVQERSLWYRTKGQRTDDTRESGYMVTCTSRETTESEFHTTLPIS